MSDLHERIAQFRKMASDDPENELGHFRLGQLLEEAGQYEEAVQSFRRTLELSPQFSKVFQLLGRCLIQLQRPQEAIEVLRQGWQVAEERGDKMPRDEMARLLTELGEKPPEPRPVTAPVTNGSGGFQCHRPGCRSGANAQKLPRPPMNDDLGRQIFAQVCADCWRFWLRDMSVKVINEMRLDLSTEKHQEVYDQIMRETLGLT